MKQAPSLSFYKLRLSCLRPLGWERGRAGILACECCSHMMGSPHSATTGSSDGQVGRTEGHLVRKGEEMKYVQIYPYSEDSFWLLLASSPQQACLLLGRNVLCASPEAPSLDSASVSVVSGGQVFCVSVLSAAPSGSSPCCCCPR